MKPGQNIIGYVSIPFGKKERVDFTEIYVNGIFAASRRVAPSASPKVYLFREDEDLPEQTSIHRRRLEQWGYATQPTETRLREEIQRHIVLADFIIADISKANPNVMLEVGFAQALGKRIIYLTHNLRRDIPSNLGDLKRLVKYSIDKLNDLQVNLWAQIQSVLASLEDEYDAALHKGAYINYHAERQSMPLHERIENARNVIQILTTNLSTLNVNYRESVVKALDRAEIENRELSVTILTSDPSSPFIQPRAQQLREDSTGYQAELEGSLRSVASKLLGRRGCSILTYDDFPVQLWHRVDETIYVGFPSVVRRSRQNCVFAVSIEVPGIRETFLQHFDELLERAKPLELHAADEGRPRDG